jgi:negative regulator of flagellin synthesis FlgM
MAVEITSITTTPLSGNKTDGAKTTSPTAIGQNNQGAGQATEPVNSPATTPVDKVTLTQQAADLRMIEKAMNEQTDIDNERIESLKLEIDTGKYDIDAQRVAEKLIEFELLFVA